MNPEKKRLIRTAGRIFGWLTVAVLMVTLITGYGITEFRTVTPLTLGLLTKPAAQRLHSQTELLLVGLLAVHVGIAVWARINGGKNG